MKIQENHRLAPYSTYQIGGPADYFIEAQSTEEAMEAFAWAKTRGLPMFVFGGGSNLLFDDEGFRGLIVRLKSSNVQVDGERIIADAGVPTAQVVKVAAEAGLSGLESWNGLPGTVGGAVYGNAGCFGTETKDVLESAEIFFGDEGGEGQLGCRRVVETDFLKYAYRSSALKTGRTVFPAIVLRATFHLQKGNPDTIREKMREIAKSRIRSQPAGSSTGSFFKNPPGDYAGRLIEAAGFKGKTVGKAKISEQHANFILNLGGATAKNVLDLAEEAKRAVKEKCGIELEQEVIYVKVLRGDSKTA